MLDTCPGKINYTSLVFPISKINATRKVFDDMK